MTVSQTKMTSDMNNMFCFMFRWLAGNTSRCGQLFDQTMQHLRSRAVIVSLLQHQVTRPLWSLAAPLDVPCWSLQFAAFNFTGNVRTILARWTSILTPNVAGRNERSWVSGVNNPFYEPRLCATASTSSSAPSHVFISQKVFVTVKLISSYKITGRVS